MPFKKVFYINIFPRIHISWWMFVLAGLTTLLIALVTISFQAIKASLANPMNALNN
ncbi:hypothetical protein [Niastella koreensis]|uniref:hypothetical protein n=1 Tax=Niastella koreensis TaxID=354356 RepID=UPI0002F03915|nr:hypothetical protein [Niastella koreensis]